MRIAIAGDWRYEIYEAACADALDSLGHHVVRVRLRNQPSSLVTRFMEWSGVRDPRTHSPARLMRQHLAGQRINAMLIWRGVTVSANDIEALRQDFEAPVLSYNNDDAFAPQPSRLRALHHHLLWRQFRSAIPAYDLNLVYRHCNIDDYTTAGSRRTRLWRSAYMPHIHRPPDGRTKRHGIVFVGHAEDDLRIVCLRRLAEAGLPCTVHGDGSWNASRRSQLGPLVVQPPARGHGYAAILQSAIAGLCFLSRQNRDTYTRRCFEIPACGTVLVAERTDDLRNLFREDEEAIFFADADELLVKTRRLLANPHMAARIALAGQSRIRSDGHDQISRTQELVSMIEDLR